MSVFNGLKLYLRAASGAERTARVHHASNLGVIE